MKNKTGLFYYWSEECQDDLSKLSFSHFQTVNYAKLLRCYNKNPLWLTVKDFDNRTYASWLFFTAPSTPLHPPKNFLIRFLDKHLYCFHGPTFVTNLTYEKKKEVIKVLLKGAIEKIKEIRPLSNTIQLDPVINEEDKKIWREVGNNKGLQVNPSYTYMARIPESEEALWKQIKSDRRTKIRKISNLDPVFKEVNDLEGLKEYYKIRCETINRNRTAEIPWDHFKDTFNMLYPTGIFKIFLAMVDDKIGSGQIAFVWNGYVNLSGVCIADWAIEEKIPINDFLQWEVLRWAINSGQKYVDFVGANPNSDDPKIKAIDSFKSRWGTEVLESINLTLSSKNWKRLVLRVLKKLHF